MSNIAKLYYSAENDPHATQGDPRHQRTPHHKIRFGLRHGAHLREDQKEGKALYQRQRRDRGQERASQGVWGNHAHGRDDQ